MIEDNKTIQTTLGRWQQIQATLCGQFGGKCIIVSVLKRDFGFTPRYNNFSRGQGSTVYIDFVSQEDKIMFILKFSDIINL